MPLAIGNIVTVLLEDCIYFELQGEVMEIVDDGNSEGPIGVKFSEWCDPLGALERDRPIIRFLEAELRRDDDWGFELKVYQCYGRNMWHSTARLGHVFDPKKKCGTENCTHFCDRRCLINLWGTVYEIDFCNECAKEYHGKCGEFFPSKPLTRAVA
jgi:hypothetical protein